MEQSITEYLADKIIYQSKSKKVSLAKVDSVISLWVDNNLRFTSTDDPIYYEALVTTSLVLAPKIDMVGILGGGDGVALREALRFPVKRVYLCESNKEVLDLARSQPTLYSINNGSLYNVKAQVISQDVLKFISNPPARFDVIISDLTVNKSMENIFTTDFYSGLKRALNPDGLFMVHVGRKRNQVRDALTQYFTGIVPLSVNNKETKTWYDYVLASNQPLDIQRPLPQGIRWLTLSRILEMINSGQKRMK